MGTSTEPWALDNERPAHTGARWRRSHRHDAGHQRRVPSSSSTTAATTTARWWTERGWAHRIEPASTRRCSGARDGGQWLRRRFGRHGAGHADEPVLHVCWYEADAYARWAGRGCRPRPSGRRRPGTTRRPAGRGATRGATPTRPRARQPRPASPAPAAGRLYPAGRRRAGVQQLIGDVWEWTVGDFQPYPGLRGVPVPGVLRGVLRRRSTRCCAAARSATDPVACRGTFRNWDYPIRRQIFAGFRYRAVPERAST